MDEEFQSRIVSTHETTVLAWDTNRTLLHDCRQSIIQSNFYKDYMKKYYYYCNCNCDYDSLSVNSNINNSNDTAATTTVITDHHHHQQQQQQQQQLRRNNNISTKHFMKHFVKYFQNNIMIWCNAPPCTYCACNLNNNDDSNNTNNDTTTTTTTTTEMKSMGTRGPITNDEIQGLAHRVEVYMCTKCHNETTFPRYNNVQTLYNLSSLHSSSSSSSSSSSNNRRTPGRCGEYANLFGLYCRALGLETRYVLDFTDHVWIEIFIPTSCDTDDENNNNNNAFSFDYNANCSWYMLDACEGVMDEYSMYEHGWGKELVYCMAISSTCVTDVTTKYTRKFQTIPFQLRRRQITSSEYQSRYIIQQINNTRIIPPSSIKEMSMVQQRYNDEDRYLQYLSTLSSWQNNTSNNNNNNNSNNIYQLGRISGSYQWKMTRHETGNNSNNRSTTKTDATTNTCDITTTNPSLARTNDTTNTKIINDQYPWLGNIEMAYNTTYNNYYNSNVDTTGSSNGEQNNAFEIYLQPSPLPTISNSSKINSTNNKDINRDEVDDDDNNNSCCCDLTSIRINHVPCAMARNKKHLSIVVMDENFVSSSSSNTGGSGGCILQSVVCSTISDLIYFLSTIPSQRIIIILGQLSCNEEESYINNHTPTADHDTTQLHQNEERLKGLVGDQFNMQYMYDDGIIYMGQILVQKQPDWSYCGSYSMTPNGIKFVLSKIPPNARQPLPVLPDGAAIVHANDNEMYNTDPTAELQLDQERFRLRTFRNVRPRRIIGRVPDAILTLSEQLTADYIKKRTAFLSFIKEANQYLPNNQRCFGYTTKRGAPIYILGPSSYPLVPCLRRHSTGNNSKNNSTKDSWNTFLLLPSVLVPDNDDGICDDVNTTKPSESDSVPTLFPQFDVPIDQEFFIQELGSHLLLPSSTQDLCRIPTNDALHNSRLVAYYFSAHWCGPCRSFTPVLAEMYTILKEAYPSNGLEIVFVSSDRDEDSFNKYFSSMPWLAIPYNQLPMHKSIMSTKYNVRGIPSFVVLDSISGQVVVPNTESRALVLQTCQAGTDESILSMFTTHWLSKTPPESQQLLDLLATSYVDTNRTIEESDNSIDRAPAVEFCSYLVRKEFIQHQEHIKVIATQLLEEDGDLDEAEAYEAAIQAVELSLTDRHENIVEEISLDGLFDRIVISCTERYQIQLSSNIAEQILRLSGKEQLVSVLTTIWKYFSNCYVEPWNPKFRKFHFSYKVADKLTKVAGSVELIESFGFEIDGTDEDYVACIPIPIDLDQMKRSIVALCKKYNVGIGM